MHLRVILRVPRPPLHAGDRNDIRVPRVAALIVLGVGLFFGTAFGPCLDVVDGLRALTGSLSSWASPAHPWNPERMVTLPVLDHATRDRLLTGSEGAPDLLDE